MSKFKTTRNKLISSFSISEQNKFTLENIQNTNTEIESDLLKTKLSQQCFNKSTTYEFDWAEFLTSDRYTDIHYYIWTKEWDLFDIRLLPYLDTKILYRVAYGTKSDERTLIPYISTSFLINDASVVSEHYKNVTMKTSVYFTNSLPDISYETKLIIFFTNPRHYG